MILLSQNNCIQCTQLKQYLKHATKVEYQEIKLEEDESTFNEYVKKFNILSTPALIDGERCLVGWAPSKVMDFIKGK